jgi:transcription initiation factor IIE alpha subunit
MKECITKPMPSKSKPQPHPINKYRVTSLEKALSILELMLDQGRDLSITEISQRLGMGKGTVHRILSTLKERRFVPQDTKYENVRSWCPKRWNRKAPKREKLPSHGHGPIYDRTL